MLVPVFRRWSSAGSLLILASLMLASCNPGADKDQAEQIGKAYFDAIQVHDYERAASFYAPQFYERTPRDKWLGTLRTINDKLGDLQSYQEMKWNVRASATTSGGGTAVELEYRVIYSKYPAEETFTLTKPAGTNTFQIIGHRVNSEGFVQE